jgi:hypothetical protein
MLRIVAVLLIAALSAPAAEADQLFRIDSERSRLVFHWSSYTDQEGQVEHEAVLPVGGYFRYTENLEDYYLPTVALRKLQMPFVSGPAHTTAFYPEPITPDPFNFPSYRMLRPETDNFSANSNPCNSHNWAKVSHGTCYTNGSIYGWSHAGGRRDGDVIELSGEQPTGFSSKYSFEIYATAIDRVPGDANGDGYVLSLDYDLLKLNYGAAAATPAQGDFNEDGVVNAADYTVWRDNLYNPPILAAVPEPCAALLTLIGFAAASHRRRAP